MHDVYRAARLAADRKPADWFGEQQTDAIGSGYHPPMRRRLFTILSVLSLLLCVGTAWAWYSTARFTIDDPTMPSPGVYILGSYPWLGWLSVGLFVTAMVMLIIRIGFPHLLGERTNPGHCPACGYDLRTTPERCPECGTVPPIAKVKG